MIGENFGDATASPHACADNLSACLPQTMQSPQGEDTKGAKPSRVMVVSEEAMHGCRAPARLTPAPENLCVFPAARSRRLVRRGTAYRGAALALLVKNGRCW